MELKALTPLKREPLVSVLVVTGYSLRKYTRRSKVTLHLYSFILSLSFFPSSTFNMSLSLAHECLLNQFAVFLPSFHSSPKPLVPSWHSVLPNDWHPALKHNPVSWERSLWAAAWTQDQFIHAYCRDGSKRSCLFFCVFSPHESKGFLHMCSCSDVSICLRKNTDTSQPVSPVVKTSPTYSCTAPPSPSCSFQYVDLCKIQLL